MGSGNGQNVGARDRNFVVLELGGGNDYLNTIVPYENGLYYDNRPTIAHDPDKILKINDEIGFRPDLEPIKRLWDEGKVAIIHGIGYPEPNRSHFRSMDIWHTAMPEEIGTEGWLGRVIRDIDPTAENVLTGVNFGRGLPRSMGLKGVPVASVGNLETYGLFPDMEDEYLRKFAIDSFAKMYGGKGKDAVMDFLGQTGASALKGADMLGTAPGKYKSSIEYGDNPIANDLKNAATVMFAGLGTRIFHTSYGSFDTHSGEVFKHDLLWQDTARAVGDFWDDIAEHGMDDDTVIFMFSEFGRRIKDNGSGTDHGSGGVAFLIGNSVKGGMYGEYPSLEEIDQIEGDLRYNNDFRMTYSSILEQWLEIEAAPIVNGRFEQFDLIKS
jgi:uncharacterized protein (DUF1501 family)